MNIKISSLKSNLKYTDDLDKGSKEFLESIETRLGEKLNLVDLEDYNADLKLIFIETGGSEGLFLKNFDRLKEPYIFLTSGENNSLAATLEILTFLNNKGLKGEIIHGDVDYISQRIKNIALINRVKKEIKGTKLGIIGTPSDWLISSIPDYEQVKAIFGIELVDYDLHKLEDDVKNSNVHEINKEFNKEFNKNELIESNKIINSIYKICKDNDFEGITLRCFDLLNSLHMTGCLALSYLNDLGIIGTCEGDIAALLTMYLAHKLTGEYTFQANPSRINVKTNEITFAHCTIPTKMCTSFKLDTHFESGIGVAVKGELKETKVTVFRMSSNLKDYYVETGTIIKNLNEKNLCRTQILVKMDNDVSELLTKPCGNHHIILYGDHKELITQFLKFIL